MNDLQKNEIIELIEREVDMTIATIRPDRLPHATTVSYVNDGLVLYFGSAANSQKAVNIESNGNIALTINSPYHFWKDIAGLSISGSVCRVKNTEEFRLAGKLLHDKFPQVNEYAKVESEEIALFRIEPKFISHLNYRKGFGHTEHHIV